MNNHFKKQITRADMLDCVLCGNAPCTNACPHLDPAALLRSAWFANEKAAAGKLPDQNPCIQCTAPCENACVRPHRVGIRRLVTKMYEDVRPHLETPYPADEERLRTDLCGVPLENPFLLSSSVVASNYDMCARAFEAGWAGAAFKTVCPFEIHEASPRFSAINGDNGTLIGFKNIEQLSEHTVAENMAVFRRLKSTYPSKVILASIMGRTEQEWADLARQCEDSGADAVELNFSCPNMADSGLGSDIGQIPELVQSLTAAVKSAVSIPVLAKLTPNVANMSPAAEAAKRGGADGISAINTIKSLTDVNLHTYVSSPATHGVSAVGGYSGKAVKPIAMRFITELGKNPALKGMYLSAMGGIECWTDAAEYIMLGAGSVQITTAVMQYGYRIIDDLRSGLNYYLAEKGISSIKDAVGIALDTVSVTTDVLERDTVIFPKVQRDLCIGCGRCEISCADGGHQAIRLNADRKPVLLAENCVGCHLCVLICPQRAIVPGSKRSAVRR